MSAQTPVLMIGLDAADLSLMERLIGEGKMPTLAKLRKSGCYGTLSSPAEHYAGGVWPSFYTGQGVPWHGIYHNKLWRAEAMRCEVPTDEWLTSRPFWETWKAHDLRVCIVDVPMILGKPRPVNGLYLGGWGTHDLISRGSWPTPLWDELVQKHGAPRMPPESFGQQSAQSLLRLTDALLRATEQMQQIACDLAARERWDFSCIVFGGIHRMGHYLTDLSQLDEAAATPAQRAILQEALAKMYQAMDGAVAHLLETVGSDTLVIVFAVHGMGPNPGWADLAPDILRQLQRAATGEQARTGLLYGLKKRLPTHWIRPVLGRLPVAMTDRLVALWSARMFDWSTTRYFPLPMDHAAYLRVNLKGREREGIVEEAEYVSLCAQLAAWFSGLRDADSGERIAGEPLYAYHEAPAMAPQRILLPDVLVPWQGPSAHETRFLISDAVPRMRFAVPRRLPSGRSGNHVGRGWFIAAGAEVKAGVRIAGHDILDLAPTVLYHLGVASPSALQGRRIELVGPPE